MRDTSAIRQARKTCQTDGTMSDWAAFEALIGQVRTTQEDASIGPLGQISRPRLPTVRFRPHLQDARKIVDKHARICRII